MNIDKALSREKLDDLKPSNEAMSKNTRRAKKWYNEAVWTAAALFVEAAEESDTFREDFVSEADWRSTLQEELPEYHEKIMGIGLSAFQGGNAEQIARRKL